MLYLCMDAYYIIVCADGMDVYYVMDLVGLFLVRDIYNNLVGVFLVGDIEAYYVMVCGVDDYNMALLYNI